MYTKIVRKIVLWATYGCSHCSGDTSGGGVGHCY